MKSRIEEPSDLLNLARRGPLTREESRDLAAWVDEAPEARALSQAAEVFDGDSSAQPGDDALIARIASRAADVQQPPRRLRRRATILLLAAALVLVGTAAAGGSPRVRRGALALLEYVRGTHVSTASEAIAPSIPTTQAGAPSPAPPSEPISQPLAEAQEPMPGTGDVSLASKAEGARPRAAASPGETADKAASLFGRANARRLAGDDAAAISLYRELADRYGGTPQALMAEIALGKLLLAKGDAAGALTHFRRYANVGGPLGVEALWGEADALRGLGRASEERRVLERLLERYPESAYATAARKRLASDTP
jgi:TolA-binding protein